MKKQYKIEEDTAMLIGGALGYHLLKWISPAGSWGGCGEKAYLQRSKLEMLLGPDIWTQIREKTVIDFGCGSGTEALEMARHGAAQVIGIDIREGAIAEARRAAQEAGLGGLCEFSTSTRERADVIISLDAFEHFDDPAAILRKMAELLEPDGRIIASFGPTWYHPRGGHLFSVFPWAHLLFSEKALIRWRSDFKTDGATRFCEVEGGLNQMTIRRFIGIVQASEFELAHLELVPIRVTRMFHNALTQEFLTSIVRCQLVRKGERTFT